ncbi:MAG: cysteine desulfurase family protein [Parcubacteria group bacterium]
MKSIYFDNSASTQVDERVLGVMRPFFIENFGNAHSVHSFGQTALAAVDEAREKIAGFLNCGSQEIIFTSGATESNNLAINGVVSELNKKQKVHCVTTKIEHPSVLEVVKNLEKSGAIEANYLKVDAAGKIDVENLKKTIKPNTVLVSIMYANNEVGSIQPIREVAEVISNERKQRINDLPLYLHVDAVQAVNYLTCDVQELGVDLLSFSGHKIYGPKGVGALFIRKGIKIKPIVCGGGQEYGLRSGTLNVPSIVGLGKAVELIKEGTRLDSARRDIIKIKKIKEKIVKGLKKIEDIRFNGAGDSQLPNIINVSFKKAEGESILMMLDMAGVAVSTGSACSSGSLEPSPVLSAMGVQPEWSHGSIRVSLGRFNTEAEATIFLKEIEPIIKKLRQMAP